MPESFCNNNQPNQQNAFRKMHASDIQKYAGYNGFLTCQFKVAKLSVSSLIKFGINEVYSNVVLHSFPA